MLDNYEDQMVIDAVEEFEELDMDFSENREDLKLDILGPYWMIKHVLVEPILNYAIDDKEDEEPILEYDKDGNLTRYSIEYMVEDALEDDNFAKIGEYAASVAYMLSEVHFSDEKLINITWFMVSKIQGDKKEEEPEPWASNIFGFKAETFAQYHDLVEGLFIRYCYSIDREPNDVYKEAYSEEIYTDEREEELTDNLDHNYVLYPEVWGPKHKAEVQRLLTDINWHSIKLN